MTSKLNFIIFALATLTGIAVRTVMLIFTVEPLNGFIKPEYSVVSAFIIAFLIVAAALIFLSSLFAKTQEDATPAIKGKFFSVVCIVMAAAIIYETFFGDLLVFSSKLQTSLQYLFAAVAAASLVYIGVCKFIGKDFPDALSIAPILFWGMRLIIVFTEFSTISTISDTAIETAGMCLTLITVMMYAKTECMQEIKHKNLYFATSLTAGYVYLLGSVPRIISQYILNAGSIHLDTVPAYTALAAAIFSIVYGYTFYASVKK